MKTTFKNKKAFTLIELLIVIAIIGILFIVLISKVDFATDKAKATGVQTDFRSFQVAIESVAKENAGLATFGWDTGDANGDRIRNSYDRGDANQNGTQDNDEVFVGSKVYGETWNNVYTLTNPADADDKSAVAALEAAINKNLDPKLHITIHDDYTITMANGAQDPWNTEYHGYYITNATTDGKDRGAIVMYSNGANQEFGSEHSIAGGVVTVNVPGNNVYGKDDYGMSVIYTYVNGYGEVKTQTSGFSNNQDNNSTSGNNSGNNGSNGNNNGNNGGNVGDLNNVPAIGDTKEFATLIETTTLEDLYDLSTSPDKEYGYASIAYNDNTYLCIDYFDDVYDIYYEFYNESEDYWYSFSYASEGIVNLGYAPEVGWYTYDDYGDLVKCAAPSITFVQDLIIDMPNGLSDIAPLFVEHKHNYVSCKCFCGDIKHMHDGLCPGLYEAGAIALAADGDVEVAQAMLKTSWNDLLDTGIVYAINGVVYSNFSWDNWKNASSDALDGDLVLPNDGSITSIGDAIYYDDFYYSGNIAFRSCEKLTGIAIPNSVTEITSEAFTGCTSLTSITIPDSVTSIGVAVFYNCESLSSVTIGNGVTYISTSMFSGCGFTSIEIPSSVTIVGSYAFTGCGSLTSVTIPSSVTSIEHNAFQYCTSLTSLTIHNGVTNIGNEAFFHCESLTNVNIPNSVTSIGDGAFRNCYILTSIKIDEGNDAYKDIDGNLYTKDGKTLIQYAIGKTDTSFTIPNSVTAICDHAFQYCDSLTSVEIPDSVASTGNYTFYGCSNLASVVIRDGVTSIGSSAFTFCTSLTSIIIPDSVTRIGSKAFAVCTSLTSITFNGSVAQWKAITKGSNWKDSSSITEIICSDGTISLA